MCRTCLPAAILVVAVAAGSHAQDRTIKPSPNQKAFVEKAIVKVSVPEGRCLAEWALISRVGNTDDTFDDLLKYARKLAASTTDVKTKKVLGKYVTTLEAMART